jgi:uncharacterized YccA/Bax inhibitor family protein
MRTTNPTLNDKVFSGERLATASGEVMTMEGAVNKSIWSILLCMTAGYWTFSNPEMATVMMPMFIVAIVLWLVLMFKKSWAPILVPAYAIVEGCALGSISILIDMQVSAFMGLAPGTSSGIVPKAIGLTFGTLLCMLVGYRSGFLKLSEKAKTMIFAATGAICLVYIVDIVMRLFGAQVPFIHSNGTIGIIFSVVVVGVAALNLLFDFEFIEKASATRSAPKYMEWFAAFGLLVTLVWLYIEILHLLMKLQSRD